MRVLGDWAGVGGRGGQLPQVPAQREFFPQFFAIVSKFSRIFRSPPPAPQGPWHVVRVDVVAPKDDEDHGYGGTQGHGGLRRGRSGAHRQAQRCGGEGLESKHAQEAREARQSRVQA